MGFFVFVGAEYFFDKLQFIGEFENAKCKMQNAKSSANEAFY